MRLIIVVATSTNGLITDGAEPNPSSWTSQEDQDFYQKIKAKHNLFLMGSGTYKATHKLLREDLLRVVLTRNPAKYANQNITDKIVFETLSPSEFVEKYHKTYNQALILGGSHVYTEFLESGLITDIYITIEPIVFKSGIPFLLDNKRISDYQFSLAESKKLNTTGTILYHYVTKNIQENTALG